MVLLQNPLDLRRSCLEFWAHTHPGVWLQVRIEHLPERLNSFFSQLGSKYQIKARHCQG